jgi:osmoprotectant transport system permease protein
MRLITHSKRALILTIAVLMLILSIGTSCTNKEPDIIIGAKDFTEQYILGHMLMLLIEENTDLSVAYKQNMSSELIFAGIQTDIIDLYVEYTGTVYGSFLGYSESKEPEEVFDITSHELMEQYNLRMLPPLGFNNTFCLAVRSDTAQEHNIKTFSDLSRVSSDFTFGGSFEILNRNDGIPNLKKLYDMSFKEEIVKDGLERYNAITNDVIQVTEVFSTDGVVFNYDLVVLDDDKKFFPPYEGVIIIRDKIASRHPELIGVLDKLIGALSDETMQKLNYKVDALNEEPEEVAEGFLKSKGLIS